MIPAIIAGIFVSLVASLGFNDPTMFGWGNDWNSDWNFLGGNF